MKKLIITLAVVASAIAFTSCSSGRYVNNNVNNYGTQTQVVLSQANYKIVKNVQTTYLYKQSVTKFSAEQLKQSAYAQLVKEAKLTGSQALINVTIEEVMRETYHKRESAITASGTVIEFTK